MAPLLAGATRIVDWYHAMEHVWDCGHKLYGERTEATTRWVKGMEALLRDGNVRETFTRLETERAQGRSPTRRKALGELITCLGNQGERLGYNKFQARGLEIGSGLVEAAREYVAVLRIRTATVKERTNR